jgi:hypothetical protein
MIEEQIPKTKTNRKNLLIGCGILVAIGIILAVSIGTCFITETKDLSASVSFDGTQFTITNNDSFDWRNVKFILNSEYELSYPLLSAKSTYTVGAMQFAKSDGTRFNPFTMKALHMSISCELSGGNKGMWSGSWE